MKVLEASNGTKAIVSVEDYERVSQYRWWVSKTPSNPARRYFYTQVDRKTVYLHRMIMDAPSGMEVDHINRDPQDNRRENLRLSDRKMNCVNRTSYNPKSGFRGVYKNQHGYNYHAKISVGGKIIRGGSFKTKEEAARKYDELAKLHFGEFAVLNFPQDQA